MKEYKILFTGAVGAGKTTAIGCVSETAPIVTDVANTDTSIAKASTTVGLDFGCFTLENGDRVRMFGTPGQTRFQFLWEILAKNALGVVILIDNSNPDPLGELSIYLDGFAETLKLLPCVIGIGRMETHPAPTLDAYAERILAMGRVLPLLAVDVRRKEDVTLLIDTLLAQLEADMLGTAE
ncbi:GTP-binding protein [Variovorax guangxiensis]|uniref:GTP-binding protein n=1 Tax=Variovorax guangxiensis TaxID=1775474 RepID=A0A433MTL7_9BURK|nr:ATP/GTP-binding protein [Variovorax guangxiensis]RUR71235.1 GTP-binding protein [Variovorax guangxiensis]